MNNQITEWTLVDAIILGLTIGAVLYFAWGKL
jgi:hypothetical protein